MKKNTLITAIMTFSISYGQYNVLLTNSDVESSTPMTTVDNVKYSIEGMCINNSFFHEVLIASN